MRHTKLLFPDESYTIRGALYEVYREIGNGLREEVYQQCLEREFALRSIPFEAKKELHIFYKGKPIEKTYIPDFLCYGKIILEIKVGAVAPELREDAVPLCFPDLFRADGKVRFAICTVFGVAVTKSLARRARILAK